MEKTEFDALQKKLDNATRQLDDATRQLSETRDSLKKAQDELTDLPAHRYQSLANGGRTWRLDSATGSTCILLTSDRDWKNSETKAQSCACEDLYRSHENDINLPDELFAKRNGSLTREAKKLGCE